MQRVTEFPREVREIENTWIPLSDGTRLAARIFLPADAEQDPVPAILEYMPYRKRDLLRPRDEPIHKYFAGHGYAGVRVDLRCAGDSDGILRDEFIKQEQDDSIEVIEWLALQPWCTGAVGMFGKSWSGFSGLIAALRAPGALKAVIANHCGDDRYNQGLHYAGGIPNNENVWWRCTMLTFNVRPPDPEIVGDRWREMWLARIEDNRPWPSIWMEHPRFDDYWRHGSACVDWSAIKCPVYMVGGWQDHFARSIPRMIQHLEVPRRGVTGPWAHLYPQDGVPGPAIGFLQDALRWYDRWLKGIDNGIDKEPQYWAWMQDSVPPQSTYRVRPGRWVAEETWPSPNIQMQRWVLNVASLDREAKPEQVIVGSPPLSVGQAGGSWCSMGHDGDAPRDQRAEDGRSITFTSEPLAERIEMLGAPLVEFDLAVDKPVAQVAVRLNDVAPDGASTRVTYAVLNLTHRESDEHPEPMEAGRRYRVPIKLHDMAYAFPAGHRLRLSVSTSYWPIVWPSPEPVTLTLHTGVSTLDLPVRPPREEDQALRAFGEPEQAPAVPLTILKDAKVKRSVEHDVLSGETLITTSFDGGYHGPGRVWRIDPIDLELGHALHRRYWIRDGDPTSARTDCREVYEMGRGDWRVRIETRLEMSCTKQHFIYEAEVKAYEGDKLVSSRSWDSKHARDLM